jgi:hypothetical protein
MTDQELKVNWLKALADKVCEDLRAKDKLEAEEQVKDFYREMEPLAARGLYGGEYRKFLNKRALQALKDDGIRFKDGGGGVSTHVSWE